MWRGTEPLSREMQQPEQAQCNNLLTSIHSSFIYSPRVLHLNNTCRFNGNETFFYGAGSFCNVIYSIQCYGTNTFSRNYIPNTLKRTKMKSIHGFVTARCPGRRPFCLSGYDSTAAPQNVGTGNVYTEHVYLARIASV